MHIRLMYKIHNVNTANEICHSAGNDTFYETEAEALEASRRYVNKSRGNAAMVIYRAVAVVRSEYPPVRVEQISNSGHTIPCSRTEI